MVNYRQAPGKVAFVPCMHYGLHIHHAGDIRLHASMQMYAHMRCIACMLSGMQDINKTTGGYVCPAEQILLCVQHKTMSINSNSAAAATTHCKWHTIQ